MLEQLQQFAAGVELERALRHGFFERQPGLGVHGAGRSLAQGRLQLIDARREKRRKVALGRQYARIVAQRQ
ncbi:MAG: hypothetical protein QM756_40950 [Polyangiaceae bacterium]